MIETQIEEIVLQKLAEPALSDSFLIEINILPKKIIEIILDADAGLTIETCQKVSRHVEAWLDTEGVLGDDYTLEVSSPGVSRPLKLVRQYPKHIGRTLEVTTTEGGKIEGVLKTVNADAIILEHLVVRVEGKKKKKETTLTTIPFNTIKNAIVKISFKE